MEKIRHQQINATIENQPNHNNQNSNEARVVADGISGVPSPFSRQKQDEPPQEKQMEIVGLIDYLTTKLSMEINSSR